MGVSGNWLGLKIGSGCSKLYIFCSQANPGVNFKSTSNRTRMETNTIVSFPDNSSMSLLALANPTVAQEAIDVVWGASLLVERDAFFNLSFGLFGHLIRSGLPCLF